MFIKYNTTNYEEANCIIRICLIALTSYAQGGSEHLTFKGIPIEGSMTEFYQKLKAKGFTSIGSEQSCIVHGRLYRS